MAGAMIFGTDAVATPDTVVLPTENDNWFTQLFAGTGNGTQVPSYWVNKVGGELDDFIRNTPPGGQALNMSAYNQMRIALAAYVAAQIAGGSQQRLYEGSVSFSFPAPSVSTIYFTGCGPGGGSGACAGNGIGGGGGGSGGKSVVAAPITIVPNGDEIVVTINAPGIGAADTSTPGGNGGTLLVTQGATTLVNLTGGLGGQSNTGTGQVAGGASVGTGSKPGVGGGYFGAASLSYGGAGGGSLFPGASPNVGFGEGQTPGGFGGGASGGCPTNSGLGPGAAGAPGFGRCFW